MFAVINNKFVVPFCGCMLTRLCVCASPPPSAPSRRAVGVGILKVMAKMGISTVASYKGAQIFEVSR